MAASATSTRYQLRLLLTNLIVSVVLNYAHAKGHHPGRQQRLHSIPPDAVDRHEFISEHNAVRAKFSEQPLTWNSTLARYARRFASQRVGDCDMIHSNGPFGENIFWGGKYEDYSAAFAVKSWAAETSSYNPSLNSCQMNAMCGHFTQIVWTTTKRMGCARVKCNNGGVFAICVYDPPGNFEGENPFTGIPQIGGITTNSLSDDVRLSENTKTSQKPVFTVNNILPNLTPVKSAPAPAQQASVASLMGNAPAPAPQA
ncbi:hypothetical protein C5167_027461 [Papaver somniferum]|uniref:pathogenesis-related protein PRB1-2-like n=1 Tax=Papaver somniferum TaxID=3469 RepID=UPI000E6FE1BC|nr:pathogenesis-related protein PRB1-2-like [Papaver somniferum]RZC91397.1 hypothetical protein C5167_027461 [Papaver somniferum]